MPQTLDSTPYDAVLLLSFGGPERPEEVVPFLENVTRGRGIPRERLEAVGEHYFAFGGRSPINDLNRELIEHLRADFAAAGLDLPVYWGNRNWEPYVADAVRQIAADGHRRVAVFTTSAYSCYSSCRQYREDLAGAAFEGGPLLDRLRSCFNHPGFVEPMVDATLAALLEVPEQMRAQTRLAFVTHSIPVTMAEAAGPQGDAYVLQHEEVMRLVVAAVAESTGVRHEHRLVYCSRSGPPQMPWLEPDVNDHLEDLAAEGARAVVVIPIGFVSDHMEVVYDLDTEARATAERLDLTLVRAATAGPDPRFASMVRDLVLERAAAERGEPVTRAVLGDLPPAWDRCAPGCCPSRRAGVAALGEAVAAGPEHVYRPLAAGR